MFFRQTRDYFDLTLQFQFILFCLLLLLWRSTATRVNNLSTSSAIYSTYLYRSYIYRVGWVLDNVLSTSPVSQPASRPFVETKESPRDSFLSVCWLVQEVRSLLQSINSVVVVVGWGILVHVGRLETGFGRRHYQTVVVVASVFNTIFSITTRVYDYGRHHNRSGRDSFKLLNNYFFIRTSFEVVSFAVCG